MVMNVVLEVTNITWVQSAYLFVLWGNGHCLKMDCGVRAPVLREYPDLHAAGSAQLSMPCSGLFSQGKPGK
jgi:hypothetical protein